MTVYIVTAGHYSDYHIEAVFRDEAAAKEYIKDAKYPRDADGDWRVEPFAVGETYEARKGHPAFSVTMLGDGTTRAVYLTPRGNKCETFWLTENNYRKNDPRCYRYMVCICHAKDKTHAVKIANEKRIAAIASGQWDIEEAKPRNEG